MKAIVQITNKELYHSKVAEIEHRLEVLDEHCFSGQLQIQTINGSCIPYYGLLSAEDYEKDYGFRLTVSSPIKATPLSI